MKTADYCRAVKQKLGIESDYALAKALGVSKQAVSNYVNGHSTFDNTAAAQVSLILGVDFLKIVADVELERGSKSPELWKRLRDAAVVAAMAIGTASFGTPDQALAAGFNSNGIAPASTSSASATGHKYTLRGNRRRRSIGAAIAALIAWLAGCAL